MYRLNLFWFNELSNEWKFLGKHTPEKIAEFESNMPDLILLTNGW
mgnify:CR=1 FL=1